MYVCVHILCEYTYTWLAYMYVLFQNGEDPKWLIATKSAVYLIVGVGMVRTQYHPHIRAVVLECVYVHCYILNT